MYKKALTVAMVAAALTTLASAPATAAAAPTIEILPGASATLRESDSTFTCPGGEVMTGRSHKGDENGSTTYQCSRIRIDGELVSTGNVRWNPVQQESSSYFVGSGDAVILGREHGNDENGYTRYLTGTLHWRGSQVRLISRNWTESMKESNHSSQAGVNQVMTGRWHRGDENGYTAYEYGTVIVGG
jgi:predicted carbohydrate-binding protein with CBM5 and CBM33 domain